MPQMLPLQGLKSAKPSPIDSGGDDHEKSQTPDDTPASYMGPDQGPFKCANCEYFTAPNQCGKQQVMDELGGDQFAVVDPEGCCNFFEKA